MEPHEQNTEIFLKNKIAIIIIPSKTGIICWARAIYLTLYTLQQPTPHGTAAITFYRDLRRDTSANLTKGGINLYQQVGLSADNMYDFDELELFQAHLAKLGIYLIVFRNLKGDRNITHLPQKRVIGLILHNGHYNLVTKNKCSAQ